MTATTAAPKKTRTARVEDNLGMRTLVLTETEHMKAGPRTTETEFHLEELAAEFGRTFLLRKFVRSGGENYTVVLGGTPGNGDACSCKWGQYGRGKPCRHVASLESLIAAGRV